MLTGMHLLIDIGNSRIKWANEQAGQFSKQQWLDKDQLSVAGLLALWQHLPEPTQIGVACVSSPEHLDMAIAAAHSCWPSAKIVIAESQAKGFGVRNAYQQPETLGVDRWLALIAARQISKEAVCIVDCGTAITLDLLDRQGNHLGGLICPGLALMKQALCAGTQALGLDARQFVLQPANFTPAAIDSGTLFAAIGLIEATLTRQSDIFKIILTGGDAVRIGHNLAIDYAIDNNLLLRGLALMVNGQ